MTSRNIKAVIEVGGQVAASLPSATRRARAELQSLEQAQQGDVRQLRTLRQSLSYVAEGSDSYNRRLQDIDQTQQGLDFRTDQIIQAREALQGAGAQAGGFRGRLMQVRAVLGPVGIAVGAATGLIVGLASAFRGAGRQGNELINTAALYGQTVEDIQKRRNLFQYFTQDAGTAQAAARNLLDVSEQFQRVRFGAGAGADQFLGAQRLGFDVSDLIQGRLDQRQIIEQAIAGVQGLPDVEARLRLEQAGFSEDVRAAVLVGAREGLEAALVYQQRQAVLSEEQLAANRDMGRNIDEILAQIGRLVQIALSGIAPPLLSMSTAILKWLAGPEGALRGERQELEFRRGEVEARRAAELEERRRALAADRSSVALPEPASPRPTALPEPESPRPESPRPVALPEPESPRPESPRPVALPEPESPRPVPPRPVALPEPVEALAADRSSVAMPEPASPRPAALPEPESPRPVALPEPESPRPVPPRPVALPEPESPRPVALPEPESPRPVPPLAADRELAEIDKRLAEIDGGLAHLRDIDIAGQYPGPLGSIPGAEQLAERGVSAGDVAKYALDPNTLSLELARQLDRRLPAGDAAKYALNPSTLSQELARQIERIVPAEDLAGQLKNAFAGALREAGLVGQAAPVNQTITNNITNNSGDDIGQKLVDAQALNP